MSLPRIEAVKITDCCFDTPILLLGKVGENLATRVVIDASEWQDGEGEFQLLVKRADEEMFTANITQEGGVVTWLIPAAEIGAAGYGEIELNYLVGEAKIKSARVDTRVFSSIEIDSLPPNGTTWSQLVLAAVGDARAAANDAEQTKEDIDDTLAEAVSQATADAEQAAQDAAGSASDAAAYADEAQRKATAASDSADAAAESARLAGLAEDAAEQSAANAKASEDAVKAEYDEIFDPLATTYIRNTKVTCTLNEDGYVSMIYHRDNATNTLIRTDTFTYDGDIVTEVRRLEATGRTQTNVYDLGTIAAEFNVQS